MAQIHRHSDARSCGATTIVTGQGTVFINGLLVSVDGDLNTHGGGALIASSGATTFINGKRIVTTGSSALPDGLCSSFGSTQHCDPKAIGSSPDVFIG